MCQWSLTLPALATASTSTSLAPRMNLVMTTGCSWRKDSRAVILSTAKNRWNNPVWTRSFGIVVQSVRFWACLLPSPHKQLLFPTSSSYRATSLFIWSHVSGQPAQRSQKLPLSQLSSVFSLDKLLKEVSGFVCAKCSATSTSCICPSFGVEQKLYSGFVRAFSRKTTNGVSWKQHDESPESEKEQWSCGQGR